MLHLLLGLFGVELRLTARRAAVTALLLGLGGVLVGIAVTAGLVAAFIALADAYGPVAAALIIAGGSAAVGLLLLIVGFWRLRRPMARTTSPLAGLATVPAAFMARGPAVPPVTPVGPRPPLMRATTVIGIAAAAAIAGAVLGRRI